LWFLQFTAQAHVEHDFLAAAFFMSQLPSFPARVTFFKKSADAFLRIRCHRVEAHDFFGVSVGFRLIQINLSIESLLAYRKREWASFNDALRKRHRLLAQRLS